MARVSRTSPKNYKMRVDSQGSIPSHGYEKNDVFEVNFQKQYIDGSGEAQFGLPSWHFFEAITGVQPSVDEMDLVGEFKYVPTETVEFNLKNFFKDKIARGEIVESDVMKEYHITEEDYKQFALDSPTDNWNKFYKKYKQVFIENHTDIVVDYGVVLRAVDPYAEKVYAGGVIPPKTENEDIFNLYTSMFFLARNVIDIMFEKEFPTYDRKTQAGKDAYKEFFGNHTPIYQPSEESVSYVIETKIDRNGDPHPEGPVNRLAYYDLRRGKGRLESIQAPVKASALVDKELDYLPLQIAYNNGEKKQDVGRNAKPTMAMSCNVDSKIIFEKFTRTLHENCFSQCYKFKDVNLSDVDQIFAGWLEHNKEFVDKLPNETITKYEKVFKHLGLDQYVDTTKLKFDAVEKDEVKETDTKSDETKHEEVKKESVGDDSDSFLNELLTK